MNEGNNNQGLNTSTQPSNNGIITPSETQGVNQTVVQPTPANTISQVPNTPEVSQTVGVQPGGAETTITPEVSQTVNVQPSVTEPATTLPNQTQVSDAVPTQLPNEVNPAVAEANPVNLQAGPVNLGTESNLGSQEVTPTLGGEVSGGNVQATPIVDSNPQVISPSGVTMPDVTATPNNTLNGMMTSNGVTANNVTSNGFVPMGEPLKKKANKGVIIAIVALLLVAIVLVGYFIVYPNVVKNFMDDPKNVYSTTISDLSKKISTTVSDVAHDKAIYKASLSLETNEPTLATYSGLNIEGNLGIDPTEKSIQIGIGVVDSNGETISHSRYLKDGKEYARYSNYSNDNSLIYIGEADMESSEDLFTSFNDLLNNSSKIDGEDYSYLIDKISTLAIESIDEEKLTKEDASITINGETLKVIANKYVMDVDMVNKTLKYIYDGLKNDEKSVEILAEINEIEKSEVEEMLTYEDIDVTDDSETLTINIYTYGNKNDVVGYEIEAKNKDYADSMHMYFKDDYFEIKATIYSSDITTGDLTTGAYTASNILITGVTENDKTTITFTMDDVKYATLVINSWTDTTKNVDYTINYGTDTYTGNVTLTSDVNDNRGNYTLSFTYNYGTTYLKLNAEISEDWTSEVADINTAAAVSVTDEQLTEIENNFEKALYSTPLGTLYQTINGEYSNASQDYYGLTT